MWQSSWRADPCLSVSALPFNPADVHVGLLLFLPPSAVFHLRAHNCLARPTAALEPKQTHCIKKSFSPFHQAPVKVDDLGKSCFTEDFPLHFSQTTASTLAPHNVKVCYATNYLTLFFQKHHNVERKNLEYFFNLFLTLLCIFATLVWQD